MNTCIKIFLLGNIYQVTIILVFKQAARLITQQAWPRGEASKMLVLEKLTKLSQYATGIFYDSAPLYNLRFSFQRGPATLFEHGKTSR